MSLTLTFEQPWRVSCWSDDGTSCEPYVENHHGSPYAKPRRPSEPSDRACLSGLYSSRADVIEFDNVLYLGYTSKTFGTVLARPYPPVIERDNLGTCAEVRWGAEVVC